MGYDGMDEAIELVNRGGGSLVASVYTMIPARLQNSCSASAHFMATWS